MIIDKETLAHDNSIINSMSNITGVKYSDEQRKILTHRGGMCVIACAGSGKTTLLTSLIAKRIQTFEIANPENLLCTTYSKGGALEMEQRLNRLLQQLGIRRSVTVKTMHALYLGILKDFGYPSAVIDTRTRNRFLMEAVEEAGVSRLDDDDFQTLDSLISYQVNNMMKDPDLVQSYVYTLDDISLEQYVKIRTGFKAKKNNANLIDFDDMQLYVYSLLCTHEYQPILDYCHGHWQYIYVDEAQDMSKIQYAILKKLIVDKDNLVVVGDDDQCIYQWRGADPSIILNVCGDYDIQRFLMSTNYRCAENIVNRASVGVSHNKNRFKKEMGAHNKGGEIKICDCGSTNLYEMSKYAYKYIKDLVLNQKIKQNQIALLSRNNSHLCILNSMLFKDGIHCESTQEMRMTKNTFYKRIRNVLELAMDTTDSKLTQDYFFNLCSFMTKTEGKVFGKVQSDGGLRLSELLGYVLTNVYRRHDIKFNSVLNLTGTTKAKIMTTLSNYKHDTVESMVVLYKILTDPDVKKRASGMLALFEANIQYQVQKNADKQRTLSGLVNYITDLVATMGLMETRQFLKVQEQYDEGKMGVPGPKICMSTMHGAKGKEWEYVVLFADDNVSFPSFYGINRQLNKGIQEADIYHDLDENRRLHYVAMTRAKKELAIFTDKKNAGLYMLESFGIFDYGTSNNDNILNMAKQGEVLGDILDRAQKELFDPSSKYRYTVDISDISGNIEIDYFYRGNEKAQTVSLDDIMTTQSQKTGSAW